MTLITAANGNLSAARGAKKDEFYTQLVDIEKELSHYRKHFAGKVVYLNCDDPRVSNFFRYFSENFEALGLKRLIATCYQSEDPGQFSRGDSSRAVWLEYDGDKNGNRVPDANEIGVRPLKGDGDFRSAESVELLRQADIVVTNPPFSLFREFVAQLVEHDKQFIILGNMNALTYKEIFPLFQNNQMWYGPSIRSGDREFRVPADYPLEAAGTRVDAEGNRYIRVKGVRWFTNLDYDERHRDLELTKRYREADYPRYANFDAINGFKNTRGEQLAVAEVGRWKIRWRPLVVGRLRAILARSDVQGAWLTTWLEQPWLLDEFEAALGLDGLMPHRADHPSVDTREGKTIIDQRFDQSIAFDSNSEWWWKRRAAELLLDRVQPARFAWIDDEIGNVGIKADPWGPQQNHQRLLLRTRSLPGLLPRDLQRVESWLNEDAP